MEDGFPLFDPNNEAERQEQKLKEYYEEFSANARKRLLSKIVNRPTNVYDVLYPQTRVGLLAKNVPIIKDLEEEAKIIRDRLIAKIVTEENDLEKISADFRNSLLARAKIQDDRHKLLRTTEAFRKNNLSKNAPKESNLEKDSDFARRNNVSKNKQNPSFRSDINDSEAFKVNNISKNTPKDQDLLRDSADFREGDVHKNVAGDTSLEKDSDAFRSNNLTKNSTKPKTLDEIADAQRNMMLAKNKVKSSDVEEDSEVFRKDDISKNVPKEQDLLRDSDDIRYLFRKNVVSKNAPNKSDIEKDAAAFRRNNLSKNKVRPLDVEADSEVFRNDSIALNKSKETDLESDSETFRTDDISKNVPKNSDLETDSSIFRKDDLSLNKPSVSSLERDSAPFRSDDLSKNKPKPSNLEADSETFRSDDLSLNKPVVSNLEEDSETFREDDLSVNKPNGSNLEIDSETFRKDDLSMNKPGFTDLEGDSTPFRKDDLSMNKPNFTNLETDSESFRSDDLSYNKPNFTNLEVDSEPFRKDDLSMNKPSFTNLENDSVPFRNDDLSFNAPNFTDLESDSVQFRVDDLSFNSPNYTDLIVDSTPFLYNNLSANVPSDSDLQVDSVPFREDDLASNVFNGSNLYTDSATFRDDDLASNIPNSSDLAQDSVIHRAFDLAANVPINTNIYSDSIPFRNDSLASNAPHHTDLLNDSDTYRKHAVAKNDIFGLLGVSVQGAGTSAFLGISRVFTQGILVRKLLESKNVPNNVNLLEFSEAFRDHNKVPNRWQLSSDEYTASNENWKLGRIMQGSYNTKIVDYTAIKPYYTPTAKAILSTDDYITTTANDLQGFYGTTQRVDFPTGRRNRVINDALFSVNTTIAKGGEFLDHSFKRQTWVPFREGNLTSTIRKYNEERSVFNLHGLQPGDPGTLTELQGYTQEGFQELVASTIGSFQGVSQLRTLTTPADIIQKNGGTYFQGGVSDTDILRPGGNDAVLGTAPSMMAKTALGNPYEDEDFFTGKRGVKHIINTIKVSDEKIASNYDPQNTKSYVIGKERDGRTKLSRQRYTIANPYAPGKAGKLLFSIKNYSSGDQFFFPPYISSIQNTENANWNSVNFLGRPEAVYTYNNSSRDASISFFVLTDYAENVDIGRDWGSEGMEKVVANFSRHFTSSDVSQNNSRKLEQERLTKLKNEQNKEVQNITKKEEENAAQGVVFDQGEVDLSNVKSLQEILAAYQKQQNISKRNENIAKLAASSAASELKARKDQLLEEGASTVESIGQEIASLNTATNYSETNSTAGNIYNLNVTKSEFNGSEIITKAEDTIVRIDTMKKGLMFQPAFFSGDKVDFVRRIEFLSKLTRPSASAEQPNTGFSFTKPPICHIRLGDWWNHDIVINSVSFDYTDSPWTLEGGRVQPMWVSVSINFNIIGPYGAATGRPPLSTDKGGMYSPV